MTENGISLLLAAAEDAGALALRDLFVELELLADGKPFTSGEVIAYAATPGNERLRRAIVANCDELSARKLGQFLAKWAGKNVASLWAESAGSESGAILWRVVEATTKTQ